MKEQKTGVREALQALYDSNPEQYTASTVFRAAESADEGSAYYALRSSFEWDKDKCYLEHNLNLARKLIKVTLIDAGNGPEQVAHVPCTVTIEDRTSNEGTYHPHSVLVEQPDFFRLALQEAEKRLNAARREVQELYEAAGDKPAKVRRVIERASESMDKASAALVELH